MRLRFSVIICAIGFFVSDLALANDSRFENITSKILTQYNYIEGKFEQERTLQGINRVIRSNGRFSIWRDNGIYWETSKPLFQATSFSKGSVYYWTDESNCESVKNDSYQISEKISQLMLAFFTADLKQLESDFEVIGKNTNKGWTIILDPSNMYVSKAVNRVTISGAEHVEKISLELATGDHTNIWLQVTTKGDKPDAENQNRILAAYLNEYCAE
ncbi:MAG: outer membrane lipoprotein carrier protein LolA [Gammaproteobacteria bacterium]|nr:outer membrane lipoprotein carrier protein LolA [Gammaproteobacteria bacterium]